MKTTARAVLVLVIMAGLWLALKPLHMESRFGFLPVHWQEYVDYMDFWFNLGSFALLSCTTWLAFEPNRYPFTGTIRRALSLIAIITCGNIAIEIAQSKIPGREMDFSDVVAGLIGTLFGIALCSWWRSHPVQVCDVGAVPKVLFIDQTGQLGGAELMLLDIASGRAADSEVVLFQDGDFRDALEHAGVTTQIVGMSHDATAITKQASAFDVIRSLPRLLFMVLRIADKARGFDLVYANTAKALIVGGPAALIARRPLVFHLHDIISASHFSGLNRWALITASNVFATTVIANSESTKAAFVANDGDACRCVVIPNGFDLSKMSVPDENAKRQRAAMGLSEDDWVLLMAGRLAYWKGQHVLLQALRQVPGAHVIFLGEALFTHEDRAYAQQLRNVAVEPGLAGRVHFAGFHKETTAFFAMADVIVHASVFAEPFGRVIVEGMLAGKPVIATRAGGAAEIISHEHTGLLIDADSPDALARALLRLKQEPEFARAIAATAQHEARHTYALSAVRAQIESVIRLAVLGDTSDTVVHVAAQPSLS